MQLTCRVFLTTAGFMIGGCGLFLHGVGAEGEPCLDNGLCNTGLICESAIFVSDADGDRWSDVNEIACGTDPQLSSSVPTDVNHDGICDVNQLVELKSDASDAEAYDLFGISVAISGDVAIVGALYEDGEVGSPKEDSGSAYIFQLVSGQWVEKQKLTASDAQAHDGFGTSVAISGRVAFVGASQEDGGTGDPKTQAGAAYLFMF